MFSSSEILSTLAGLGVTARVVGDDLRLIPGSEVPPELLPEIRRHKSEILDALRTPTPTPPDRPESEPSATPATPATFEGKRGSESQESQESQGVPAEKQAESSPNPKAGPEAAADALTLAGILDEDPGISLDDIRARAAAVGIEGLRFAHGLAALPPKYDAGPGPQERLDAFLKDQPRAAGDIAGEVLDELKAERNPLPSDLQKWPAGPRYVCALLARRGMPRGRAIEGTRRWWLLGADLRAALAMGWPDAENLLKGAGSGQERAGSKGSRKVLTQVGRKNLTKPYIRPQNPHI